MIYMNNDFNEMFDRIFGGSPHLRYKSTISNVGENDERYEVNYTEDGAYLFFDAAGFNKTNLKVEMESGVLRIEGKRTYKLNGKEKNKIINKEFNIGERYNPNSLEATIEDGLLTVFIPNYKKSEKTRINLL